MSLAITFSVGNFGIYESYCSFVVNVCKLEGTNKVVVVVVVVISFDYRCWLNRIE